MLFGFLVLMPTHLCEQEHTVCSAHRLQHFVREFIRRGLGGIQQAVMLRTFSAALVSEWEHERTLYG